MDYGIFNMCTDVNACNCTWGCVDTIRVCTESWLWEKNPLLHQGTKPVSAACWSDALPTEQHPHPPFSCILPKCIPCFHFEIKLLQLSILNSLAAVEFMILIPPALTSSKLPFSYKAVSNYRDSHGTLKKSSFCTQPHCTVRSSLIQEYLQHSTMEKRKEACTVKSYAGDS